LAGCALLAVVIFSMAIADKHRTLGGQIWGVIGLSAPCLPILLGGEISPAVAVVLWGTWLLGFASTTMAVRGVIAAQKRQSRVIHWSALVAISITVAALAAAGFRKPIVTLPMLAMAWYLVAAPPPAQQLKRVGWTLVAGTVVSAIWMVLEQ
ncbi:MAG: hypothetical protein KDB00_22100, partial [Planctomycetales bacterium]|nr:hypothetical protein [Planctomycetales bacterium]